METFIFVLHIFSCLFLISLILVQSGQGANMGAAFGGASQTVFGSRGPATFLNKLTVIVAVIFLGASIFLANAERTKTATSVVDEAGKVEHVAPAAVAGEEEGTVEPEAAPASPAKEVKEEAKQESN